MIMGPSHPPENRLHVFKVTAHDHLRERPFDFYGGGGGGGGGQEDYICPGFFFQLKLNPVYFFERCLILDIFFS